MEFDFDEDAFQEDTQDYVCSITSREFELFCMEVLKIYGEINGLHNFQIKNNVKRETDDATYQLDIYACFTALDVKFEILCECKQYTSPVKREKVELLESRLRNLGMQKGILLSTSGFQRGAIQFAKSHGIALIQVYDHSFDVIAHSSGPENEEDEDENDPIKYMEDHWPPYRAICFSEGCEEPLTLYPTKEMVDSIFEGMNKILKEQYGFKVPLHRNDDGRR